MANVERRTRADREATQRREVTRLHRCAGELAKFKLDLVKDGYAFRATSNIVHQRSERISKQDRDHQSDNRPRQLLSRANCIAHAIGAPGH